MYTWKRYDGYECSSKGDTRFSALFAQLPDGRTIEEAWQLDCKGYRIHTNNWRDAKGKPPLEGFNPTYAAYKELWATWAKANPELMRELATVSALRDHCLSDMFASTNISQARALAELLNEGY
ncbi:hypothetical protein ST201phi2-1p143 [Pseudomonas phage 201phi2-1]|uniref:Uncharacterized protein n=1 Tax=Pseudomonas phage 201phi2-1 TaxID=198110 RepID=B3FJ06_BP201|nr:hypothetical protein ST201phi2-1p143 [Pseudomonas phage 201phi2-1]ABY63294.1 hypothetical protein 201phi2-1p143 [Pseudomonas phage 201phi2-1]